MSLSATKSYLWHAYESKTGLITKILNNSIWTFRLMFILLIKATYLAVSFRKLCQNIATNHQFKAFKVIKMFELVKKLTANYIVFCLKIFTSLSYTNYTFCLNLGAFYIRNSGYSQA